MSEDAEIRASDDDRESVAGELRERMLAGRVRPEELGERVRDAYDASIRGELARGESDRRGHGPRGLTR